jgi:hypothetical protein
VTPRSVTYSKASIKVLAKVWEASGYLCSQRLKATLPQWLPWIKKHFKVNEELEKELLAISARQMDRRLFPTSAPSNDASMAPLARAHFSNT